jgi:hypothetical protein
MMIKKIVLILIVFISANIIKAESITELINSAKNKNKFILIKVFNSDISYLPFDSIYFGDRFIEASLHTSNPADAAIIDEYRVEAFPSIILLNSNGYLILPVKKVNSLTEIEEYLEIASKTKYDSKPPAQLDLEYHSNKMNKAAIYEYIAKRTSSGLDNSDIIDQYTQLATANELLNKKTILLFLDENNINIPGSFFSFVEQNQEEIKQILKMSDDRFCRLADKSMEYSFQKICTRKDEPALSYIIDIKVNIFNGGDKEVMYNEYMTRYFHATYQPLKLANHVRAYVTAIFKHKEQQDNEFATKNKRLFSPQNSATQVGYAAKLRDAAQYVVEILSAKSILNDALSWSITAEQMTDDTRYDVYETQAYILYKLGKKDDAIVSMEKAYNSIPQDNIEQRKNICFNLIKMKRGEKIY